MPWRCFMVEPAAVMKVYLRRYESRDGQERSCPGPFGYHNAQAFLCEQPQSIDYENFCWVSSGVEEPAHDDARWPTTCEYCDYEFADEDHWQVHDHYCYVRPDTGEIIQQRDLPPGAMFDCFWHKVFPDHIGSDGRSLCVVLPPGGLNVWCIDGPASSGGHWTRSGEPPDITASPSILTGTYHGFLQSGVLTDSLPDRPLAPGPG